MLGLGSLVMAMRIPRGGGPIVVSSITPSTGPSTGGTSVTIEGSGFPADAVVLFINDAEDYAFATDVVVVNQTEITCTTPPLPASVASVRVAPASLATFGELTSGFTFEGAGAAPVLSAMSTDLVDTAGGGKALVLTGSNFLADGATPKIDGVAFGAFTVDSDTQITCTVPAHAPGTVSITVTNANGSSGALSLEFWDPSVPAPPTGDWKDYAGAPWVNAGSVGAYASEAFDPPIVGAALNSHDTADFTHPQVLTTDDFVNRYIPADGFELFALVKVRTTQPSGATYDDPAIFSDPYTNIGVTDDGVQATIFSSGWQASGYHSFTPGTWQFVNVSHDGVDASLSVDNDTPTTWPVGVCGRPDDTYSATIGRSAPSTVTTLDHLLARLITYPAPLTSGDRINAQKYFVQKYDL